MEKDLFICDLLEHQIKRLRDINELNAEKANIADALCGVLSAIEYDCGNDELLNIAKDVITSYHFLINLMAIDIPKIPNHEDNRIRF